MLSPRICAVSLGVGAAPLVAQAGSLLVRRLALGKAMSMFGTSAGYQPAKQPITNRRYVGGTWRVGNPLTSGLEVGAAFARRPLAAQAGSPSASEPVWA